MDGPSGNKKFERNLIESLEMNENMALTCFGI